MAGLAHSGQQHRKITAGIAIRKANERPKDVLNKPHEKLEIEYERDQKQDHEVKNDGDIDRGPTHGI